MPVASAPASPPQTARVPPSLGRGPSHSAWLRAGWPRALLGFLLGGGLGFGLVLGLRALSGLELFQTEPTGYPHLIVPAITAPLGFIWGIGCFDFWLRWASGAPRSPTITQITAPIHGATTCASTPTTR